MKKCLYPTIKAAEVPVVDTIVGVEVKVLVGQFHGVLGPVSAQAFKPLFLDCCFKQTQSMSIPCDEQHNFFIYCYEGQISIGGEKLIVGQLAVLNPSSAIELTGEAEACCIVVDGLPIGEPVVQHGPFVMNTEAEIHKAFNDFRSGRFA